MNATKNSKGKRYIACALVAALAGPVILNSVRGRISEDLLGLFYGVLIGLAIVFLAAGSRALRRDRA